MGKPEEIEVWGAKNIFHFETVALGFAEVLKCLRWIHRHVEWELCADWKPNNSITSVNSLQQTDVDGFATGLQPGLAGLLIDPRFGGYPTRPHQTNPQGGSEDLHLHVPLAKFEVSPSKTCIRCWERSMAACDGTWEKPKPPQILSPLRQSLNTPSKKLSSPVLLTGEPLSEKISLVDKSRDLFRAVRIRGTYGG